MIVNANTYEGNFFNSKKSIKCDPRAFFGYVDLKKSALVTRRLCISKIVWHRRLLRFFADFKQRTYADDVRGLLINPGLDLVQDDPPYGALQFTFDEVQSVLLELDVKVAGPDDIPPLIVNNCASSFRSLSTSAFPDKWQFS
jgi:hypothetical protein